MDNDDHQKHHQLFLVLLNGQRKAIAPKRVAASRHQEALGMGLSKEAMSEWRGRLSKERARLRWLHERVFDLERNLADAEVEFEEELIHMAGGLPDDAK